MNLVWLKAKLTWIGMALVAALAVIFRVKYLENQRDNLKEKVNELGAEVQQNTITKRKTEGVRGEFVSRRAQAKKEVKDGKVPSNLSDPSDF